MMQAEARELRNTGTPLALCNEVGLLRPLLLWTQQSR